MPVAVQVALVVIGALVAAVLAMAGILVVLHAVTDKQEGEEP